MIKQEALNVTLNIQNEARPYFPTFPCDHEDNQVSSIVFSEEL